MIQLRNIKKDFDSQTHALRGINLDIQAGEFVAIIGLSGAGKSTLLRSINKMVTLTSGEISVNGLEVMKLTGKALRQHRKRIGMIFQSFNLIKRTTVINNVLAARVVEMPLWRCVLGLYRESDQLLALDALDTVHILEKAYERVDRLSGGQQQRVAIARCLAQKPEIILADEPISSLDPVTSEIIMEDLQRINETLNLTIIVNLHHVEMAVKYAKRIIGIKDGQIVFDGLPNQLSKSQLYDIYGKEGLRDVED
jgi:phosphonate transport system ATP-binding protein